MSTIKTTYECKGFLAFTRLANARRHGSRLKKVLAKRAMGMRIDPALALVWSRRAGRLFKASPKLKNYWRVVV